MMPRLITKEERAARASPPVNTVRWRKKGCKSCKPIVVPTRPFTIATN